MSKALEAAGLEPDPVIEAFKKDVDRTLIQENLKLTVDQRLRQMISFARSIEGWRDAARKASREREGSRGNTEAVGRS